MIQRGGKKHGYFDCYSTYADAAAETSAGSALIGLEIQHFFYFFYSSHQNGRMDKSIVQCTCGYAVNLYGDFPRNW